jgi:uncharacterized membrane protein (UPF0127 family)
MKTFLAKLTVSLSLTLAGIALPASAQTQQFHVMLLMADGHQIRAEVAATEAQREQGLMRREKLAADAGMVFVFEQAGTRCMWMQNTSIALSVAFIDADGRVVNIEDMQPHTLDSHCSKKGVPVLYALEMHSGWFQQKNIKPGSMIDHLPMR